MRFKVNGGGLEITLRELLLAVALLLGVGNSMGLLKIDDKDRFTGAQAEIFEIRIKKLETNMEKHVSEEWHGPAGVQVGEVKMQLKTLRREVNWMQGREFEGTEREK
jgi:hypothetical protein